MNVEFKCLKRSLFPLPLAPMSAGPGAASKPPPISSTLTDVLVPTAASAAKTTANVATNVLPPGETKLDVSRLVYDKKKAVSSRYRRTSQHFEIHDVFPPWT